MPRHQKAMKDVASCDKLRGVAHTLWSGDVRMGKPTGLTGNLRWTHSLKVANEGKWNISVPSGIKIIRDFPSSGERTGNSPNLLYVKNFGCCTGGVMGLFLRAAETALEELQNSILAEESGKAPQRRWQACRRKNGISSEKVPKYHRTRGIRWEFGGTTLQG